MSKPALLAGDTAAAVIRALLDYGSIWTTHDVVTIAEVPAAAVHPVVRHLEATDLITRLNTAVISVPDWFSLLSAWCEAYSFTTDHNLTRWTRTLTTEEEFLARLGRESVRHAITGVAAARTWIPLPAGDEPLIIYTRDADIAAEAWELIPAADGDIILAEPSSTVVFERFRKLPSEARTAAPTQVLADLLTGAHPSLDPAKQLATWMESNERLWRY